MAEIQLVAGIDLGTTNSEVAAFSGRAGARVGTRAADAAVLCGNRAVGGAAGGRGRAQPAADLPGTHGAQHQAQDGQRGDRHRWASKSFSPAGDFRADPARTGGVGAAANWASRWTAP